MTVVVAFALSRGGGTKHEAKTTGPPPPITAQAPPSDAAATAPCAQVLSALPVQLGRLSPRVVHTTPDSPNVVAWGDPAVVLRCGVPRPAGFVPTSDVYNVGSVYWMADKQKAATVWTTIDRAVYVEVTVPLKQPYMPLPLLGTAIASKLEAVCVVPEGSSSYREDQLCTHRH